MNIESSDFAGNNRFDGGDGIDTLDYTQGTQGIVARLDKGVVLKPIYGALTKPKIMPLGDSITEGANHTDPVPGTYRIQLWKDFSADSLRIDFVGSGSNGPSSLGDKDHEGHGGWTIDEITSLVNSGTIDTYQPDIVLLMIGTNDLGTSSPSQMSAKLSNLIDRITQRSPKTQVLVSSIAPQDPSITGEIKANKIKDFNALIPGLVNDKVAQGKKVTFVDATSSVTVDELVDGVHPNLEGYNKIGNAWYNGLVERDTLNSIENIVGTQFNDKLVGNAGVNTLQGGAGKDTLTGGAGADTFVYGAPTEGKDTITDFSVDDRFQISAAGFGGGLVAGTSLSTTDSPTGVFVSSDMPTSIGTSANFLYNTKTGVLDFDADGTGANPALSIAKLAGAPSLASDRFYIS